MRTMQRQHNRSEWTGEGVEEDRPNRWFLRAAADTRDGRGPTFGGTAPLETSAALSK
jgi:hypothetical protein